LTEKKRFFSHTYKIILAAN